MLVWLSFFWSQFYSLLKGYDCILILFFEAHSIAKFDVLSEVLRVENDHGLIVMQDPLLHRPILVLFFSLLWPFCVVP